MACRYVHDPLEQKACDQAYDSLHGVCSRPGVAIVLRSLAAGEISKEEADKRLKALWKEDRKNDLFSP